MLITRASISVTDVATVARTREPVSLDAAVTDDIVAARAVVERVLLRGEPVYGLNTELGAGRNVVVSNERLEEFQRRTIRNSLGGVGEALSDEQARAVVFARLVGFSRGGAGVTLALASAYVNLLNDGPTPVIPRTGSVGAADLTHLAAIASSIDHVFQPHEALAALSSNAYSVGVSALLVSDLRELAAVADLVVARSIDAIGGNHSPFDERIQAAHPVPQQALSAQRIRDALGESTSAGTQDAISFRSAAQVHASFGRAIERLADAVEAELNSRTENPLVDVESDSLISGGNFLVLELALALDGLRVAIAHVAAISERRLAVISGRSADARRRGETTVPGLLWYSASAQLAELRHLANPVSLAGTALSEGVEDHATNAPLALQLLERSLELTKSVLSIEAVSAAELAGLPIHDLDEVYSALLTEASRTPGS
jgi:histidine ammonia-lyase